MLYLSESEMWYCDGTFYVCPSIFYQIYSIRGYNDDGIMAPYVYCLLPGKSETLYTGLQAAYKDDEQLRMWFRLFAAVALLPLSDMIFDFNYLIQNKPKYPQLICFVQYFHQTYGAFSTFPSPTYNHFMNFSPRTTNHVEGRHFKWKKRGTAAHPNIYCTIDLLRQEQSLGAFNALRDHMGVSQPNDVNK
ncbi:unnamed protein product [Didymodactylos carnosus]|uniref:MULE transposase domain-containing protein n=1 Tax=Didymodactylos carnosus TaxID=1234261 RepID=A0A814KKQ4_9BILA|nr:unnamed protein product [Didymodactylos carnosus]CAF3821744.1 unnamed protein product [Didymodactylos carnosus]